MELRNCPECGKLFAFMTRNLCPACLEAEERLFQEIESYLRQNPGATVSEVSQGTGVDEKKIIFFLRNGRLIGSGTALLLECERCGKPIKTGRFCDTCRAELGATLKEANPEDNPRERSTDSGFRMHAAEIYRRRRR